MHGIDDQQSHDIPNQRLMAQRRRLCHFQFLIPVAVIVLVGLLFSPITAHAQGTITVDTTVDDEFADTGCSLREAITSANTDADIGSCVRSGAAPYTITVPAGVHQLLITGTNEEDNATGDLDIRTSLVISGAGSDTTYIQAGVSTPLAIDRVLHISGTVDVTISGVTIRNGNAAGADESGGGVAITGGATVQLIDSAVTDNSSQGDAPGEGGGGLFNDVGSTLTLSNTIISNNTATNGLGNGGGILSAGTLMVMGGEISDNEAARAGGGVENDNGTTTFTDLLLSENIAGINGGGLHISGSGVVTMTGGTATGNDAAMEGGALWNSAGGTLIVRNATLSENTADGDDADQGGGAIHNDGGTLTVTDTTITNNTALGTAGSGGGILAVPGSMVTVSGGEIRGNSASRAGGGIEIRATITDVVTATIAGVMLTNNETGSAPGNGGALHITGPGAVTVSSSTVMSNTAAAEGGGLWNSVSGTLTVDNTVLQGNSAAGNASDQGGGGLFTDGGMLIISNSTLNNNRATGTSGSGGGILVNLGATLEITGGTISGNSAMRAGGGIEVNATVTDTVAVTITNVDLIGNSTGSAPGNGGALHITGPGTVAVSNSTVMSNTATAEGGGLWNSVSGTLTVNATTLQDNSAAGNDADQGGGGLFNDGGTLIVTDSTLNNNRATGSSGSGGGILVNPGGTLEISGGTISGNSAMRAGGGIEVNATVTNTVAITVTNVDLVNNSTGSTPGNGGGLHITGPGTAHFMGGSVSNNMAAAEGGGLWNSVAGTLTISGTIVSFNMASGDASDQGGGGLYNDGGTLTVTNVELTNNQADGDAGSGGGILAKGGVIMVSDSTLSGNMAMRAGGGIEVNAGTMTDTLATSVSIDNVTFTSNSTGSAPGNGGALHTTGPGDVTVANSTIANNTAAAEGGGLWNSGSGTLVVTNSRFETNVANGSSADQGGGALFNDGGTLTVSGATLLNNRADGTSGSGGGILNNGGTLTVSDSTLSGNTAMRAGGAIEDNAGSAVTIAASTLNNNSTGANPGNGGALHITGAGAVTVTMSSVMSNTATAEGGGLWNSAVGTLVVDKTTLSANMASGSGADQGGGALFNDGGTLHVSNSTVSGNSAVAAGGGLQNAGDAEVINVTFYENSADNGAGGISSSSGTIDVANSIVAHMDATGADCSGVNAGANNLDSDGTCQATLTGDPMLGPLATNNGTTMTHALADGSPAVDAGDNAVCAAPPINNVDQRGVTRPVGDSCDLGAYEGSSAIVDPTMTIHLPIIFKEFSND